MKAEEDKLLSTAEVAGQLGVTRQRVLELITEERLPATKVGRAYVIRAGDVASLELRSVGRPSVKKAAKKGGKK
ncbi:MAG TPA: helix-turn-helix domain-containing protein [Pyrinomonadaceae bacterium]|nr:helix-turn-helix domain-containing protein [Pyrinomonadaceae bacterium]